MAKKKMAKPSMVSVKDYANVLLYIKDHVRQSQVKAALAANTELIELYWSIGKTLVEQQQKRGWGSSAIERLADDLQREFPGVGGFSRANVFRMQAFYVAYEKVAQAVRQITALPIFHIPWGHNIRLLQKVKSNDERLWYAQKAIELGWSRVVLETQIDARLYRRQGKAISNFSKTLLPPHSDMAQQATKDPYVFDFLTLREGYLEREFEDALIDHVQKFLLELGQGFAFIGRQVHLTVGGVDYYIDLLFYHTKLRCHVVVELKVREFEPKDAGQISFYLAAVDDLIKHQDDKPTIGLILCKEKDSITVEYALRKNMNPIGVASYKTKLVESLPKNFKGSLPTVEEIEGELEKQTFFAEKRRPMKRVLKKVK
jgi:predicted nuclease of restriction endonuclease-like (RecB) superfamily